MKPHVKFGLIVGAIGAVLNIGVATVMGLCGPGVALIAGAIAGFLAAKQAEALLSKSDGARMGGIAGAIAGSLILVGQLLGAIGALILIQQTGMELPVGSVPTAASETAEQVGYYLGGLGTGVCFGVIGIIVAGLAGAAGGYLGTPEQQVGDMPQ